MGKLIEAIKHTRLSLLLAVFSFLGPAEIVAMQALIKRDPVLQKKIERFQLTKGSELQKKVRKESVSMYREDEMKRNKAKQSAEETGWYVYGREGKNYKTLVDENILKSSKTIKSMLSDLSKGQKVALPFENFSIDTIKESFDIIRLYNEKPEACIKKLDTLSIPQLLRDFKFIDFLDLPKLKDILVSKIRKTINSTIINSPEFTALDPDAQKLLMYDPIIDCLTNETIKRYAQKKDKHNLLGTQQQQGQRTLIKLVGDAVAFSYDGKKAIATPQYKLNAKNVVLYDISNPSEITTQFLSGHPEEVISVAASSECGKIVSTCKGGTDNLILWDIDSKEKPITSQLIKAYPKNIWLVALSPKGDIIAIVSSDPDDNDTLTIFDVKSDKKSRLTGHEKYCYSVAFSPDGTKLVSVGHKPSGQHQLIVWDVATKTQKWKSSDAHNSAVKAVFSPDGKQIVSVGVNTIIICDTETGNIEKNLSTEYYGLNSVRLSPDGKRIFVAGNLGGPKSGFITVFDAHNGKNIGDLITNYQGLITSLALSPDGNKILFEAYYHADDVGNHTVLWTLLSNEEEEIFKNIYNCPADQVRLLFQLCSELLNGSIKPLDSDKSAIYKQLPPNMQELLNNIFFQPKPAAPQVAQPKPAAPSQYRNWLSKWLPQWLSKWLPS